MQEKDVRAHTVVNVTKLKEKVEISESRCLYHCRKAILSKSRPQSLSG